MSEYLVPSVWFVPFEHISLLMSGGAIPANHYKSSTYGGLRHPVIAWYALFSSGSNLSAYVDLAHTGAAYSAIE